MTEHTGASFATSCDAPLVVVVVAVVAVVAVVVVVDDDRALWRVFQRRCSASARARTPTPPPCRGLHRRRVRATLRTI